MYRSCTHPSPVFLPLCNYLTWVSNSFLFRPTRQKFPQNLESDTEVYSFQTSSKYNQNVGTTWKTVQLTQYICLTKTKIKESLNTQYRLVYRIECIQSSLKIPFFSKEKVVVFVNTLSIIIFENIKRKRWILKNYEDKGRSRYEVLPSLLWSEVVP